MTKDTATRLYEPALNRLLAIRDERFPDASVFCAIEIADHPGASTSAHVRMSIVTPTSPKMLCGAAEAHDQAEFATIAERAADDLSKKLYDLEAPTRRTAAIAYKNKIALEAVRYYCADISLTRAEVSTKFGISEHRLTNALLSKEGFLIRDASPRAERKVKWHKCYAEDLEQRMKEESK